MLLLPPKALITTFIRFCKSKKPTNKSLNYCQFTSHVFVIVFVFVFGIVHGCCWMKVPSTARGGELLPARLHYSQSQVSPAKIGKQRGSWKMGKKLQNIRNHNRTTSSCKRSTVDKSPSSRIRQDFSQLKTPTQLRTKNIQRSGCF